MSRYRVAQIGGDGIGPEVIAEAVRVLEAAQPDGARFSFQPCQGSAPDIAGKGIANPIAAIPSAALMCRWLGLQHGDPEVTAVADRIDAAVARALPDSRAHTRDIGGAASTR